MCQSETTMVIAPDGTIRALAIDELGLAALGHVSMQRWSNVEWNEAKQVWEARLVEGNRLIAQDKSRDTCIRLEREYWNLIHNQGAS